MTLGRWMLLSTVVLLLALGVSTYIGLGTYERVNALARANREANCVLKYYDLLTGQAGSALFRKAHVLDAHTEAEVREAFGRVLTIPSARRCDAGLQEARPHRQGGRAP